MAETLFIRVDDATETCSAIAINTEGRIVQQVARAPLEALTGVAAQRRVVALLPGGEVITTEAALPPASPARLRQMLPYSLEDTFAEDVDRLAFAAGKRLDQGGLAVSVVARHTLDGWLEAFSRAGLRVDAVYAETDGVPDAPSTLNLLLEGDRIYGRRAGRAAFAFAGLALAQVYDLLAMQSPDGADLQHIVLYTDEEARVRHDADIAELRVRAASLDVKTFANGALPHLASTLTFAPGTNLLQGAYAPRSNWRALGRPWYAAAGLLAAAVLVALLSEAVEYVTLQREDTVLTETLTARCNELAATTRLSACATAAQRRLSEAGAQSSMAGESFLSTLATVAEFRPGDSLIDALSYRNSVMDLQLTAPSVPSLDTFAQQIVDTDRFVARIQSANPSDAGVEGRIQVVGADNP
jgi:general secretion pathway protein L